MKKLLILFLFPITSYAQTFVGLNLGYGFSYADIWGYDYSYTVDDIHPNFPIGILAGRILNRSESISIQGEINYMKQGYKLTRSPNLNHAYYRSVADFTYNNISTPLMVRFALDGKTAGVFISAGGGPVFTIEAKEVFRDTASYSTVGPPFLSTRSESLTRHVENNNKTGFILTGHAGFLAKIGTRYMLTLGVKGQYGIVKIYKENPQLYSQINGNLTALSLNMSFSYLFKKRSENP